MIYYQVKAKKYIILRINSDLLDTMKMLLNHE